jgi:hypothetical protein
LAELESKQGVNDGRLRVTQSSRHSQCRSATCSSGPGSPDTLVNKIDHLTTGGRKCEQVIACLGRRAVFEAFEQPDAVVGDGEVPSENQNKAFDRRVPGGESRRRARRQGCC